MSKRANPGEMRTPVIVEAPNRGVNENGYPTEGWKNVFGDSVVYCKWVNVHGKEVFEALSIDLKNPATLTMRYSPKITGECRILKAEDKEARYKDQLAYEIISIDDVDMRHEWLEIKVERKTPA